jgi:murein DD-endopeptidase MepM/ murein hydrolase activator NlpD
MLSSGQNLMVDSPVPSGETTPARRAERTQPLPPAPPPAAPSRFEWFWEQLSSMGLAESALRLGTHLLSLVFILAVVWAMGRLSRPGGSAPQQIVENSALASDLPSPTPSPQAPILAPLPEAPPVSLAGIPRQALMHTTVPGRPRLEATTYTVQAGDTVFDVAERFALRPETILWANYAILADDPHRLRPNQELNILPVDGAYYEWQAGDGLNGVASFYGVTPETIVNFPGNSLDAQTVGDYSDPNIEPGTWLIIPGGEREFVTWSAPRIPRSDPSVAKVLGPGYCGAVTDGPVGTGGFIWPANNHFLSGYDYQPAANHFGVDIDGETGDPVYAADNGVVVYAGWNDWGYGNMIVIDHGNGWQSLYAHLSALSTACGGYVYQGNLIGAIGSTGNSTGSHLHFELMNDQYGKVNPWNFLQ